MSAVALVACCGVCTRPQSLIALDIDNAIKPLVCRARVRQALWLGCRAEVGWLPPYDSRFRFIGFACNSHGDDKSRKNIDTDCTWHVVLKINLMQRAAGIKRTKLRLRVSQSVQRGQSRQECKISRDRILHVRFCDGIISYMYGIINNKTENHKIE